MLNIFKKLLKKHHYNVAYHKFFPKNFEGSDTGYFSSPHEGLYPSEMPQGIFDTGYNDYNVITKNYLHEFILGKIKTPDITPGENDSEKVKRIYKKGKKWILIEAILMAYSAKKKMITAKDVQKALGIHNYDLAQKIFLAPQLREVGYPIDRTYLSEVKFRDYNEILSSKTIDGYKKVDHSGIAFALFQGIKKTKFEVINHFVDEQTSKGADFNKTYDYAYKHLNPFKPLSKYGNRFDDNPYNHPQNGAIL